MSEQSHSHHYRAPEVFKDHKLIVFVVASIALASVLVLLAMQLYNSSGTAQLDLSRPGLSSVRSDAAKTNGHFAGFSSNGSMDQAALNQFNQLYSQKLQEATSLDAFGNDVLSPAALQIDDKSAQNPSFNQ